ncbi:MAG: hypothetical protein JWM68_3978 [Verrucomicrobiales bacterium]|nr:hypothetical protein [Verrucomicrobiales bacterium]
MSGESFWSVSDKPGDPEKVSGGFLVNRKGWKLFLLTLSGPRRPGKHVGRFSSFRKSWHLFVESRRVSGKPSRNVFAESGFRKNAPETGAAFSGSPETQPKRAFYFFIYPGTDRGRNPVFGESGTCKIVKWQLRQLLSFISLFKANRNGRTLRPIFTCHRPKLWQSAPRDSQYHFRLVGDAGR